MHRVDTGRAERLDPFIPPGSGNLPNSRGFEGMAISPDGRFLYPMLEGALKTDPDPEPKLTLRIFEFDTVARALPAGYGVTGWKTRATPWAICNP